MYPRPPLSLIFASYNVIDVLDDAERREVIEHWRGLLGPGGLLIFSSHNLNVIDGHGEDASSAGTLRQRIGRILDTSPYWAARQAARVPARIRNRRRLAPLQRREDGYAIVNDEAHDHSLLHYYVRRDDQERQLIELGFELIECLDLDGNRVERGEQSLSAELHYVARPLAGPRSP